MESFEFKTQLKEADFKKWFSNNGFQKVAFDQKGRCTISTNWLNRPVFYKLNRRANYTTFYKEGFGGAIMVFEVFSKKGGVKYNCYCPILLFGFWKIKLKFRNNASGITKYRKEGYIINQEFIDFILSKKAGYQ